MKKVNLIYALLMFFSVLFMGNIEAQFDNLYYNPETDEAVTTYASNSYDYDEVAYEDSFDDRAFEDDYDYQYTSRVRRFRRFNNAGFGYYDPCFVDRVYYDPFFMTPATSIYVSFGNPWGFGRFNRWNRWNSWNSWNNPWAFNNGWGNPYDGWNNGWGNPYGGWNNAVCYGNSFYYGNNFYGNGWGNGWNNGGWNNGGWYNNDNGNNNGYYGGRYGGSTTASTEGQRRNPNYRAPEPNRELGVNQGSSINKPNGNDTKRERVLHSDTPQSVRTRPNDVARNQSTSPRMKDPTSRPQTPIRPTVRPTDEVKYTRPQRNYSAPHRSSAPNETRTNNRGTYYDQSSQNTRSKTRTYRKPSNRPSSSSTRSGSTRGSSRSGSTRSSTRSGSSRSGSTRSNSRSGSSRSGSTRSNSSRPSRSSGSMISSSSRASSSSSGSTGSSRSSRSSSSSSRGGRRGGN